MSLFVCARYILKLAGVYLSTFLALPFEVCLRNTHTHTHAFSLSLSHTYIQTCAHTRLKEVRIIHLVMTHLGFDILHPRERYPKYSFKATVRLFRGSKWSPGQTGKLYCSSVLEPKALVPNTPLSYKHILAPLPLYFPGLYFSCKMSISLKYGQN